MSGCRCNYGLGNTGLPNCKTVIDVARRLFDMPLYDSTGARNGIPLADVVSGIDQDYWDDLINNPDKSKRLYPTPDLEAVTNERPESQFETSPGGTKQFLKKTPRTFSAEWWNIPTQFIGPVEQGRCVKHGKFILTTTGQFVGEKSADGTMLYPIAVDEQSLDVRWQPKTDTTGQKLIVTFDWAQYVKDENLWLLEPSEFSGDLFTINGLLDIEAVFSGISTTGATVYLTANYGTFALKVADTGLLLADSVLSNTTTPAVVVKSTWVESTLVPGTYSYTHAAQSAADVMRLTITKDGRDYTLVTAKTYVIP